MLTDAAIRPIANRAMTAGRGEMAELLQRKGWRELPVSHAWRWRKNLPAQYRTEDAYAIEVARKVRRKGAAEGSAEGRTGVDATLAGHGARRTRKSEG
jgi:hypothetical protein